jgi:FtsH-binding integral membrane protein
MSPGLTFIKQEWRGMSLPLLAVVLLCTAAYLEAKQNRFAMMLNTLPWILCLLLLVKPALTFRGMDGESQAAFIVMITLSSTFLAIVLLSYAWSRHSSRTL